MTETETWRQTGDRQADKEDRVASHQTYGETTMNREKRDEGKEILLYIFLPFII